MGPPLDTSAGYGSSSVPRIRAADFHGDEAAVQLFEHDGYAAAHHDTDQGDATRYPNDRRPEGERPSIAVHGRDLAGDDFHGRRVRLAQYGKRNSSMATGAPPSDFS
jgi:hypothetical protein